MCVIPETRKGKGAKDGESIPLNSSGEIRGENVRIEEGFPEVQKRALKSIVHGHTIRHLSTLTTQLARKNTTHSREVTKLASTIIWELDSLEDSLELIDWMARGLKNANISYEDCRKYCKAGIGIFYSKIFSISDYLAKMIVIARNDITWSPKLLEKYGANFPKLQTEVEKRESRLPDEPRLPHDFVDLIEHGVWIKPIRDIRNDLIHNKAQISVMPLEDVGLTFQVHKEGCNLINKLGLMYNNEESLVVFDLYAGLYGAYLIDYIEKFGKHISSSMNLEDHKHIGRSFKELPAMYKFIEQLPRMHNR